MGFRIFPFILDDQGLKSFVKGGTKSRDVTRDEQHGFFGSRVICNFQIAGGHLSQNQGKRLNKNMFTRIFSLLHG